MSKPIEPQKEDVVVRLRAIAKMHNHVPPEGVTEDDFPSLFIGGLLTEAADEIDRLLAMRGNTRELAKRWRFMAEDWRKRRVTACDIADVARAWNTAATELEESL